MSITKKYKIWIDETRPLGRQLVTFHDFHGTADIKKGYKNNTLHLVDTLQPNQNPYQEDSEGNVYRVLYGKKRHTHWVSTYVNTGIL